MSSSTSRSRRPSTATLQQFASRGNSGSSSYHSTSNFSLPHKHSNGDNTSATTAESTSWSSSRSANYGVFPRSHPSNHHPQPTAHHSSSAPASSHGGGSSRTIAYFQKQQHQLHQSPVSQAPSPPRDGRYASSPRRTSARSAVPQQQQQQQQQQYVVRHTYRDDYSRSQHSAEGDDSWNNRTDISIETPPQQAWSSPQRKPPRSDPGTHNRFAAHVNRFATVDPRMDYSESLSPPASPQYQHPQRRSNSNKAHHNTHGIDMDRFDSQNNVRQHLQHHVLEEKKEEGARFTEHLKEAEEYPDPDFDMEQMLAAEQAYIRQRSGSRERTPRSFETASAATTSVLQSPSANRTRHLARRFEERLSLKGSSGSSTTSGNNNNMAPPWHRETNSYARGGSLPPQSRVQREGEILAQPPLAGETAATAAPELDYRSRSEIETPSPARVSALKQKLWDASESLNVKVRPSSTRRAMDPTRHARSLSPKTSRRVFQHYNQSQQQHHNDAVSTSTPIRNPTHFEWTETRPIDDDRSRSTARDDRSAGRDDRSYRSRDDRSYKSREDGVQPAYSNLRDDRSRSSSHQGVEQRRSPPRQQHVRSPSNPRSIQAAHDPYENSGGELQNSPFFKSRFFEAAEKTVENQPSSRRSLSRANSSSSDERPPAIVPTQSEMSRQESLTATRFFQRQLEATEDEFSPQSDEPFHTNNDENDPMMMPPTTGTASSVGSGARGASAAPRASSVANSALGVNSYASTPIVTNRPENVAHLLAKLQSVNRDDPTSALREIDAILKAESSDPRTLGHSAPPPPPPPAPVHPMPPNDEDDDDVGDSETETTVSSITNPTFSGHGKHRKKREDYRKHQHYQSQPLPTTVEGEATAHGVKPLKEPSTNPAEPRRRKVRSPPPDTIQVSGNRGASARHNVNHRSHMDRKLNSKRPPSPVQDLNKEAVVESVDKTLPAPYDSTAELAQKIRRWDELSGKGSSPEVKIPEILSDTTEGLGSIVTPSGDASPNKLKAHHPWDASIATRRGKIDVRDTSMDNGVGIETKYSPHSPSRQMKRNRPKPATIPERRYPLVDERNNPFAQDSDHESRSHASRSREGSRNHIPQETVLNMSADFDDAWVTLPTSTFFTAQTPERGSGTGVQSEASSPMPPPVSAKKASVEKFSPKRSDGTDRVMDYEAPSPKHRDKPSEVPSAYDEKRVDQARSEDECENDGVEITLVGEKKETKRKGLRALLQRRNSKPNLLGSSSVVSASSRRRNQSHIGEPQPRSTSRGRRRSVTPSRERSHSLEERTIRNPNIARKFSRLLRVYNEEDRRPAEV